MTFIDNAKEIGRHPIYLVRFGIPRCPLTFGTSPCTAVAGTNDLKCFQTFDTCRAKEVYKLQNLSTLFIRLSSERIVLPGTDQLDPFPILTSVKMTPTELNIGKGMSLRETVDIEFQDIPASDAYIDRYLKQRSYDSTITGTFFGKLKARFPYFTGLSIVVTIGFNDEFGVFQESQGISRSYIIESFTGPDTNGRCRIVAKDRLIQAYNVKAKCPIQSTIALENDLSDISTSFLLNWDEVSAFPLAGEYIRIDDEIMEVTASDAITKVITVNRATMPNFYPISAMESASHEKGATVQICKLYNGVRADIIIKDLLENFAGIASSFFMPNWLTFGATWLSDYVYYRLISEPKGVTELVDEICRNNIILWYDTREGLVKYDTLRPRTDAATLILSDNESIIEGTFKQQEERLSRRSQVWLHFGIRNPVLEADKLVNFQSVKIVVDTDSESEFAYNSISVIRIFNDWLPVPRGAFSIIDSKAQNILARSLAWHKDPKTIATLMLDMKDYSIWVGDVVDVDSQFIQDFNGKNKVTRFIVSEAKETLGANGPMYAYKLVSTGEVRDVDRFGLIGPDDDPENPGNIPPDYLLATTTYKDTYAFIANDSATMSNGDAPYRIG